MMNGKRKEGERKEQKREERGKREKTSIREELCQNLISKFKRGKMVNFPQIWTVPTLGENIIFKKGGGKNMIFWENIHPCLIFFGIFSRGGRGDKGRKNSNSGKHGI